MLYSEIGAAQKHGLGAVPIVSLDVFKRADRADEAGVVEEDVEAAKFVTRALHKACNVIFGRDIGSLKYTVPARFAGKNRCFFAAFDIQVGGDDFCTFASEE